MEHARAPASRRTVHCRCSISSAMRSACAPPASARPVVARASRTRPASIEERERLAAAPADRAGELQGQLALARGRRSPRDLAAPAPSTGVRRRRRTASIARARLSPRRSSSSRKSAIGPLVVRGGARQVAALVGGHRPAGRASRRCPAGRSRRSKMASACSVVRERLLAAARRSVPVADPVQAVRRAWPGRRARAPAPARAGSSRRPARSRARPEEAEVEQRLPLGRPVAGRAAPPPAPPRGRRAPGRSRRAGRGPARAPQYGRLGRPPQPARRLQRPAKCSTAARGACRPSAWSPARRA